MLLNCQLNLFTHSLYFTRNYNLNPPSIPNFPILNFKPFRSHKFTSFRAHPHSIDPIAPNHDVSADEFNFDSFLSLLEISSLLSSTILTVAFAVNTAIKKEILLPAIGNKSLLPFGVSLMVFGVLIGVWIRRRQWKRVCRETVKDGLEVNLLERIEKLEEDLKSAVKIVRVLSRQLEKLGIRFRVTRKGLKEPINETAALAQKNSEAARALAVQSDVLEKELGEIQQVLLAMQEQQRKQLDLILAIVNSGKLGENKRKSSEKLETSNSAADEVNQEVHQI
ncbi:hypothetical protein Lal_00006071 [Lupinus albus]|uniref:Uncharacterized protein n=1 Tax=Lupinus albus TaxID=3870 RepID=A0A6A5MUV0_LUPAL|nr:hypothetical protein Lalb_Chr07g0185271 [Lupinus albus]KAF1875443.1 hypothetical protein Lal_00006071 [Lupinus albus]